MDGHTPMEEFATFVAAMPREVETNMLASDAVSTAFILARRAGWSVDALIGDAQAALRRADNNVGVVVSRLRTLSTTRPSKRSDPVPPPRYRAEPVDRLPADWVRERRALLGYIVSQHLSPDEAETAMRGLIREQRARAGAGD